jgi:hypothetical protein
LLNSNQNHNWGQQGVKVKDVLISDIKLPYSNQQPDVDDLAASIEANGLINAITLDRNLRLICGRHRVWACKKLDWKRIPAHITDFTVDEKDQCRLLQIDENVVRAELSLLDRSCLLLERKKIYERLNRRAIHRGRPKNGVSGTSFSQNIAKNTGLSQRTIQRDVQIASRLTSKTIKKLKGSHFENSKRTLFKLSRIPAGQQEAVAAELVSGSDITVAAMRIKQKRIAERNEEKPSATVETPCLRIVPASLEIANALIQSMHRHHRPVLGHRFSLLAVDVANRRVVGAVVVGRPVARAVDQDLAFEVTRLVTDGTKNACSMLYAAAARVAKEMGAFKIQTYTLDTEPGTSLRGAGWTLDGMTEGRDWNCSSRGGRRTDQPQDDKQRWVKNLNPPVEKFWLENFSGTNTAATAEA